MVMAGVGGMLVIDVGPGLDDPIWLEGLALTVTGQLRRRRTRLGDQITAVRSAPFREIARRVPAAIVGRVQTGGRLSTAQNGLCQRRVALLESRQHDRGDRSCKQPLHVYLDGRHLELPLKQSLS